MPNQRTQTHIYSLFQSWDLLLLLLQDLAGFTAWLFRSALLFALQYAILFNKGIKQGIPFLQFLNKVAKCNFPHFQIPSFLKSNSVISYTFRLASQSNKLWVKFEFPFYSGIFTQGPLKRKNTALKQKDWSLRGTSATDIQFAVIQN